MSTEARYYSEMEPSLDFIKKHFRKQKDINYARPFMGMVQIFTDFTRKSTIPSWFWDALIYEGYRYEKGERDFFLNVDESVLQEMESYYTDTVQVKIRFSKPLDKLENLKELIRGIPCSPNEYHFVFNRPGDYVIRFLTNTSGSVTEVKQFTYEEGFKLMHGANFVPENTAF